MKHTFLGQELQQEWQDLFIWEKFFALHPVATFIEIGTGHGGMTLFFALHCKQRGITFHTFDHQGFHNFGTELGKLLGLESAFHFVDVFSDAGQTQIVQILNSAPHPVAVFFDNGNKPREWKLFAPHTLPGDYCIVHDWETEFKPEDVGDVKVDKILMQYCDARIAGWKSMWFKRL